MARTSAQTVLPRRVRFGGQPRGEEGPFEGGDAEVRFRSRSSLSTIPNGQDELMSTSFQQFDPFPHLRLLLPVYFLGSPLLTSPLFTLSSCTVDILLLLDYLAFLLMARAAVLEELEQDGELRGVEEALRNGFCEVRRELEAWRRRRRRERERERWELAGRGEETEEGRGGPNWRKVEGSWRDSAA